MTEQQSPNRRNRDNPSNNLYWIYGIILLFILFSFFFLPDRKSGDEIYYKDFEEMVVRGQVEKVQIVNKEIVEVFLTREASELEEHKRRNKARFFGGLYPSYTFRIEDAKELEKFLKEKRIKYEPINRTDYLGTILQFMLPLIVLAVIWIFFMRRIGGAMGGSQLFNIGKSRASLFDKDNRVKITFSDVAGLEEAKQEVVEIVEFLKNPQKFTKLGGHIPKGVLLVGPPGTGKTLLAKAVAGEAQVPFFSLSGSDFVEMFVGVGAARVRDLFKQAKDKAPCIIFIDEIDAIGRSRGRNNITGGNDERENTLNQLLVEMDGFNTDVGVIIMAATNRPDVLDTALMRPGRFDRMIAVDRPDIKEREAIFRVHLNKIITAPDVDLKKLSAQTPGFVGADIMNVCNEAALIAARRDKERVEMQDFQDAIDRVIGGLEKKNKIISPEEKRIVAYHEAGHALCGWYLEFADPLVKVSIVPRGVAALGYAQYLPKEQYLYTYDQLFDSICTLLGGRAAEDIIFGKISTGAQNDLERITKIAYGIVTVYGMNQKVGNISFHDPNADEYVFRKPYSEALSQVMDEEVQKLVQTAYDRVRNLLIAHQDELEKVARLLLEKEVIYQDDLIRILGPRPWPANNNTATTTENDWLNPEAVSVPVSEVPEN
jgi:cell division protease FtsH